MLLFLSLSWIIVKNFGCFIFFRESGINRIAGLHSNSQNFLYFVAIVRKDSILLDSMILTLVNRFFKSCYSLSMKDHIVIRLFVQSQISL
jgi:hypothetical protein